MIALKLLLLLFLVIAAPAKTVRVSTQAEFDGLNATVRKALAAKPSALTVQSASLSSFSFSSLLEVQIDMTVPSSRYAR